MEGARAITCTAYRFEERWANGSGSPADQASSRSWLEDDGELGALQALQSPCRFEMRRRCREWKHTVVLRCRRLAAEPLAPVIEPYPQLGDGHPHTDTDEEAHSKLVTCSYQDRTLMTMTMTNRAVCAKAAMWPTLEVFPALEGSTSSPLLGWLLFDPNIFMKLVKVSRIQWSGHSGSKIRRGKHGDARTGLFKYTTLAHRINDPVP